MKYLILLLFITTNVYSNDTAIFKSLSAQKHIKEFTSGIKINNASNNQYFSQSILNFSISIWGENYPKHRRRKQNYISDLLVSIQFSPYLESNFDSLEIRGNSFGFRMAEGFDLFKENKTIDLLGYYGFGISRKNVNIDGVNFYNPEISAISGILIRLQYKSLNVALGINGGIDISNPKWRTSSNETAPLKGLKQHFYEPFISIGYNQWHKNQ